MTTSAVTQDFPPGTNFSAADATIRKMRAKDIWEVLVLGFEDLRQSRTDALAIAIIYPISGVFLASVIVIHAFLPFVFPICAGFALIGPMATLWFAAVSRQRERKDATALSAFTPARLIPIQRLCVIAIMLFVVWNVTAGIIYGLTLGSSNVEANAPFFPSRDGYASRLDIDRRGLRHRRRIRGVVARGVFHFLPAGARPGCDSNPGHQHFGKSHVL